MVVTKGLLMTQAEVLVNKMGHPFDCSKTMFLLHRVITHAKDNKYNRADVIRRQKRIMDMSETDITGMQQMVRMMTHYMAWANTTMFNSVSRISEAEIVKERQTNFGNIAHTFNHILVVHNIFQAHLEGKSHSYTARNTETSPPIADVREQLEKLDQYYVALANQLSQAELDEVINFTFVGGGDGAMTRSEILLHLVNHSTYHRGFISDMLYQVPHKCDSNDLPVFLRDAWPSIQVGR